MIRNLVFSLIIIVSTSCFGGNANTAKSTKGSVEYAKTMIKKVLPVVGTPQYAATAVKFSYELNRGAQPDSVLFYFDHKRVGLVKGDTTLLLPEDVRMGLIPYYFEAFRNGVGERRVGTITVLAKNKPQSYSARIVKTYPHDEGSYTQGLIFHNGKMLESTGLNGESRLLLTDIATGKILKSQPLSDEFFGEGIALLNNKIYMLTWEENTCFVFDAQSFAQVGKFGYDGEGWGLATDGEKLYQSDGSNRITVRSAETFRKERVIQVFDDNGPVIYLNEMEWINGEIWANVYTTNDIVRINPQTGEVVARINFDNLISNIRITADTDVMNGIAYDKKSGRIFVTGKKWNKLFEVELVKEK